MSNEENKKKIKKLFPEIMNLLKTGEFDSADLNIMQEMGHLLTNAKTKPKRKTREFCTVVKGFCESKSGTRVCDYCHKKF